jgi:hypothetical protein
MPEVHCTGALGRDSTSFLFLEWGKTESLDTGAANGLILLVQWCQYTCCNTYSRDTEAEINYWLNTCTAMKEGHVKIY